MSVKCYYAPPEPEYYRNTYDCDCSAADYAVYMPDDTPYEYEPCMPDFPAYLREMYLVRRDHTLRLTLLPSLPVSRQRVATPPQLWQNKGVNRARVCARGGSFISPKATYTPVNPFGRVEDDNHVLRPAAARVTQELLYLSVLYDRYSSADINDYIEQLEAGCAMLRHQARKFGGGGRQGKSKL